MKTLFTILACTLFLNTAHAQSHSDVVASVKSLLAAQGVSLADSCGAFQITKHVAWALRGEGAGLLDKPSGNNCQGYAVDIIAYPDGRIFDILTDSGGSNGPTWNASVPVEASRWRPAFDVSPGPTPISVPPPPPPVPIIDLSSVVTRLDSLYLQAERIFAAQEAEAQTAASAAVTHDERLRIHSDESHTFFGRVGDFLTNGKTLTAVVAVLSTYMTTKAVNK